jgi:hypothetical protein
MRTLLASLFCFSALHAAAQDKYNYVSFNKLIEVSGTSYVIATIEDRGKLGGVKNRYLLFIDTKTGQSNQVALPKGGYLEKIEQIRIDALGINQILVSAQTVDLNRKAGIDWNDPTQILILSPDGKERTQLTDSSLFVRTWAVNSQTGTLVVTGHYDSNNNGKYDKTDKNEIGIYDLKTLKLIQKI